MLDEYKREKADLNGKLQEVQVKTNSAKQTLEQPEMIETYIEHKEAFNHLENQLPEIVEQLRDFENITEKRGVLQKELTNLEETLQITNQPFYPTIFDDQERNKVFNWRQELAKQAEQQQALILNMQQTEHELNLKNQKLDQFDDLLWDNQEFKNAEEELKAPEPKKQNNLPAILIAIVGIISGVLAFFTPSPLNWVMGLVGVLAIVIALTRMRPKETTQPNLFLKKEFEKQVSFKKEWQDLLGEADALQADYQVLLSKNKELIQDEMDLKARWTSLLRSHKLPQIFDIADAETLFKQVDQLHEAVVEDETLTNRQAQLKQTLETETASISEIMAIDSTSHFQEKITVFRQYLTQVKTEIAREQEKLDQLNALKQEEKQLKSSIENTTTKIQNLIDTAGVKEEAGFITLYQQKEKVDN